MESHRIWPSDFWRYDGIVLNVLAPLRVALHSSICGGHAWVEPSEYTNLNDWAVLNE